MIQILNRYFSNGIKYLDMIEKKNKHKIWYIKNKNGDVIFN